MHQVGGSQARLADDLLAHQLADTHLAHVQHAEAFQNVRDRLRAVAEELSPEDVDGIWLFPPLRHEGREWGVAVVSIRAAGDRRRIYTASYMLVVRGRERGQAKTSVEEVGEGPATVVSQVIRGVQERAGEAEPPVEVSADVWFPAESDGPVTPTG